LEQKETKATKDGGRIMRTLLYKRTHIGDPDKRGRFGVRDCMGKVRTRAFDAVVGIGGIGSEARSFGIDGKVNWIGIGPRKSSSSDKRGPVVTFDHFLLFESDGPDLQDVAPVLAKRMYSRHAPRLLFDSFDDVEQAEIDCLLSLAKRAPPSAVAGAGKSQGDCRRNRQCSWQPNPKRC
jgi:hypothetical protein